MKLSQKIRNARLQLSTKLGYQISQAEFGRMCGWKNAQSRCSNYETGTRAPSLEDLLKIIAVSGVTPSTFFDPEELEGMQMDHVETAFEKVATEAAIPKSVFRTRHMAEIENSVEPFLVDPSSPFLSKDLEGNLACFTIKDGVAFVDLSRNAMNSSGQWMLTIATTAVPATVKALPNGKMVSEEFGELVSGEVLVLGEIIFTQSKS